MPGTSQRIESIRNAARGEQSARIMAEKRASVRDIGELHDVVNRPRRDSCERDLSRFLQTYMPRSFFLAWSPDHTTVLGKLELAILDGGLFSIAMPRGNGKTTIVGGAALWGILYGHRRFIAIIGAEAGHAKKIMEGIMVECGQNDMLFDDFPEVCCAVRHIDGIGQRASGQTYRGKRTHISWKQDKVVCPMIPDSQCGGSVIMPRGLTGAIRGMQHKTAEGDVLRPDFVLLDDPQTEESAKSALQCDEREELIEKAVLGLAGPTTKIAAVMPCTIIQNGDLAYRFLNADRHPEWQGECMKMVYEWPDEQEGLWTEYAEIRRDGMKSGDQGKRATEFYEQNRAAMDAGARVAWELRYNDDEISALQHAENLRIDRGEAPFFSEYQNDPQKAHPGLYEITFEKVLETLNGFNRFLVPAHALFIDAFIDINPAYGLHYVVMWFAGDMTGGVLDYGKFPEAETVPLVPKGGTEDDRVVIAQGLDSLCKILNDRVITKGGDRLPIDALMIDCGYEMDVVFKFCNARQRVFSGIKAIVPSRGWGSSKALPKPVADGMSGNHMVLAEFRNKGKVIVHTADYWRMHAQKAFLLPVGTRGSLSIYGQNKRQHEKLAKHIAAEQLIDVAIGDRHDSYQWYMQPGQHNDLLDCVVGCCVGASFRGCDPNITNVGQAPASGQKRRGGPRYKHHDI